MNQLIAQARVQFEQILSYIQGEAQNQQLHEVEKGIFSSLLKIGLTLLSLFFQLKGVGRKNQTRIDSEGVKRLIIRSNVECTALYCARLGFANFDHAAFSREVKV
jgi:hypothetical protein